MTKKTKQKEKYMKDVCGTSNFIYFLLTERYGFNERLFPSISFRKEVRREGKREILNTVESTGNKMLIMCENLSMWYQWFFSCVLAGWRSICRLDSGVYVESHQYAAIREQGMGEDSGQGALGSHHRPLCPHHPHCTPYELQKHNN